ncbi:MAG TPA: hypothetical protein ENI97_07780 [Gammaproteobacteria bacterium]|nr:hypothetical protein [Gammaproteobacteria bacterium]
MPRDDAALHTNSSPANRTVNETQPYPATQAVQAHEEAPPAPNQRVTRNQRQRRRHERRQKNIPVLLDTRSGRERRNALNRQGEQSDGNTVSTGIDIHT